MSMFWKWALIISGMLICNLGGRLAAGYWTSPTWGLADWMWMAGLSAGLLWGLVLINKGSHS